MSNFEDLLNAYIHQITRAATAATVMTDLGYKQFQEEFIAARNALYDFVKVHEDRRLWIENRYEQLYEKYGEEFEEKYGFRDDDETA